MGQKSYSGTVSGLTRHEFPDRHALGRGRPLAMVNERVNGDAKSQIETGKRGLNHVMAVRKGRNRRKGRLTLSFSHCGTLACHDSHALSPLGTFPPWDFPVTRPLIHHSDASPPGAFSVPVPLLIPFQPFTHGDEAPKARTALLCFICFAIL